MADWTVAKFQLRYKGIALTKFEQKVAVKLFYDDICKDLGIVNLTELEDKII